MSMRDVLERAVFSVDGTEWTWSDVVEAARVWGEWDELERTVKDRAESGVRRPRREVEAAAEAFRYERNLLAVDDTRRWFESWGIRVDDWLSHLASTDEAKRDPERVVWMEAVTSGLLERAARRLARGVAAHHALGEGSPRPAAADLGRSLERFAAAASPDRLEAVVAERRLAWTTFRVQEIAVADEGVAQEVVHSVHEGNSLRDTARAAGTRVVDRSFMFDDAPPELQTRLSASEEGELLGPVRVADHWLVVSVVARVEPRADDPAIARIARHHVVEQALTREVARRVRWLDAVMTEAR